MIRLQLLTAWVAALSLALAIPPAAATQANVDDSPATSAPARFQSDAALVTRIFSLADERLAVMPDVAAVKWKTHAPILDPPREAAVIQRALDLSAPMGLPADSIRRLFELQVRLAREVQSELHAGWKSQAQSQAAGPPSSSPLPTNTVTTLAELRPHLDALTVGLLRAIYIAAPVLQQPDFATQYASLARRQLHTAGWTDHNRQELLEVLATVHLQPVPALARISSTGLLRVGTTGDYAPFCLEANGTLTGSDIEIAKQLAKRLHAQPVFLRTTWSTMLDGLRDNAYDLSIGGVSITPAREAVGEFSIPYNAGGKTIVARCTDASKYRGLNSIDRPQVRVIVNPGGTNEQYVRANLHRAQIVVFPDNRAIFDEIIARHADIMVTDDVEAELQTRHHPGLCRTYRGTLTHAEKAILMPRDPGLVKVVNEWLAPAIAAGEPARILKNYLDH